MFYQPNTGEQSPTGLPPRESLLGLRVLSTANGSPVGVFSFVEVRMAGVIDFRKRDDEETYDDNCGVSIAKALVRYLEREPTAEEVAFHVAERRDRKEKVRKIDAELSYGYVYLMGDRSRGVYKIGHSIDPTLRMKDLQKKAPFTLELVHAVPSTHAPRSEAQIHRELREDKKHLSGEWLVLSDTFVEDFCSIEYFEWGAA